MNKHAIALSVRLVGNGPGLCQPATGAAEELYVLPRRRQEDRRPGLQGRGSQVQERPQGRSHAGAEGHEGGAGVWGPVPMPANNISEADAKTLVKWVMSQK